MQKEARGPALVPDEPEETNVRRFRLPERFKAADVKAFEDPLGTGWVWHLRFYGNADYLAWKKVNEVRGQFDPYVTAKEKSYALAASRGAAKKLRGKALEEFIRTEGDKVYEEILPGLEIERAHETADAPEGLVACVIDSIEGIEEESGSDVREVPYCDAVGMEILTLGDPVPEDLELVIGESDEVLTVIAGTPLGVFYRTWIRSVTTKFDTFRESALETAGKDSSATSDGE